MTPATRKYTQEEVDEMLRVKKPFAFDLAWFLPTLFTVIGFVGNYLVTTATLGVRVSHLEEQIPQITHEYARRDTVDQNKEELQAELKEIQSQMLRIEDKVDAIARDQAAAKH